MVILIVVKRPGTPGTNKIKEINSGEFGVKRLSKSALQEIMCSKLSLFKNISVRKTEIS